MLIKICGVRDPATSLFAATQGVHFIGMILSPGFRRSVTLLRAKQIAEAARAGGAEPVAVFVSETPEQVEMICHELEIGIVQYYPQAALLPSQLRRFYINEQDALLREGHDYLLLESGKPGCGERIDRTTFTRPEGKDFFLAGGLDPENVKELIELYRPCGVDISSGVEKDGNKNRDLILEFINQVNSCEH